MAKEQFFGIKYPFSVENERGSFMDLNASEDDRVKSEVLHIIFTPKGQRLRMPDFGSDLVKYIFEPCDAETWDRMKSDIRIQISKYLPNVTFQNISVLKDAGDDNGVYASVSYSVKDGNKTEDNKVLIKVI